MIIMLKYFTPVYSCGWFYVSSTLEIYFLQKAHGKRNSWLPPPWAIMAMLILGLNEIMFLLR